MLIIFPLILKIVLLLLRWASFLYLSAMQYMDAVVGNSSSGIIEAPSLKIATINIGDSPEGTDSGCKCY